MIKVLKFGGASIKNSERIANVFSIINNFKNQKIIIVFSAIANVTNLLEDLVDLYFNNSQQLKSKLLEIRNVHAQITKELFEKDHQVFIEIEKIFSEIDFFLKTNSNKNLSFVYDQIVSAGELLSSQILSNYLTNKSFENTLVDARDIIKTNDKYQNANIDWALTKDKIKSYLVDFPIITQGFIGSDSSNNTTTLGREGSDFTAAIIANVLNVSDVTIWKDVDGVLNADPRYFNDFVLLDQLPYSEAVELAFYGAKVIHPRTIQPLQEKNIPLIVRSFLNYDNKGTIINNDNKNLSIPSFIVKENQVLISISDNNLSFIIEEHLSWIFFVLDRYDIRLNLMQNSAVSFSICVDNKRTSINSLIAELSSKFKVYYNDSVKLFTIRHYNQDSIDKVIANKKVLLEQKSRNTVQFVVT
jgi:aspartate kinase